MGSSKKVRSKKVSRKKVSSKKVSRKKVSSKKVSSKKVSRKKAISKIISITKQLKSGLTIHIKERNNFNNNTLLFMVKTGGLNEGKYSGISHLLEHLFLSGTKTSPSSSVLNKSLEKYGTIVNGYTSHEVTTIHMTFPPSKLNKIFKIFCQVLKESVLNSYKIEEEKTVVLNEKFYRQDLISNELYKKAIQYIFNNTIMEELVIGDGKTLKLIKKHHLHAYIVSQYVLKNCVVVLSGKLRYKQKDIEKMMYKELDNTNIFKSYKVDETHFSYKDYKKELDYFNKINNNSSIKNIKFNFNNKIFKSKYNQIYVYIYFKIKSSYIKKNEKDEKDYVIQKFINTYLNTGMSSLLSDKIREQEHLTYNIKTSRIEFSEFDLYSIKYNILSNNIYLEKSLKHIYDIINTLKTELLTKDKIKSINNKRLYRKLMFEKNNDIYSQEIGEKLLFTDINSNHYKKFKNKKIDIEKIKPLEIKNYCNKIFDKKNRCILLFSPIKSNPKINKLLNSE